jgi:hypothetical protein
LTHDDLDRLAEAIPPRPEAPLEQDEPDPPVDRIDPAMRRQIRVALEHLRKRDLYDVLGLKRDAALREIVARADAERQKWMQKAQVTAEKTAGEKAAAQAKAEETALPTDLVELKAQITRATAQVDLTTAKLEALSTSKGDLDKPSEDALGAIEVLETETNALKSRGDEMRDRGAAYFEAWEKQLASMSTPEVVARATSRKEELSKQYADVLTAMQEGRSAYDVFWADLQATVKAVDDGLTADKVKLMAEPVAKMKKQAATVKERITTLTEKVDRIGVLYTSP